MNLKRNMSGGNESELSRIDLINKIAKCLVNNKSLA